MIGGRDIADDRRRLSKCKAIVGTLGRLLHLVRNNVISLKEINTVVLDEADKLVSNDFKSDIDKLFKMMSADRQVIASSATYADGLDRTLLAYMKSPIAVSSSQKSPILIGVKQFFYSVEPESAEAEAAAAPAIQTMLRKIAAVKRILRNVPFKQCILFSNSQLRAESYHKYLTNDGWTVDLILGSQEQSIRTSTFKKFCSSQTRILIASDLMARGVDVENVNLVINLDVPGNSSTYLHRVGRCGRFGSHGIAVTLSVDESEEEKFRKMLSEIGGPAVGVLSFPRGEKLVGTDLWKMSNKEGDAGVFGLFGCAEEASEDENQSEADMEEEITPESEMVIDEVEEENVNLLQIAQLLIGPAAKSVQIDTGIFDDYTSGKPTDGGEVSKTINVLASHPMPSRGITVPNGDCDFIEAMKRVQLRGGASSGDEQSSDESSSYDGRSVTTESAVEIVESDAPDAESDFHSGAAGEEDMGASKEPMVQEARPISPQPFTQKSAERAEVRPGIDQNAWFNMYTQQLRHINQYVYFASRTHHN